MKSNEQPLNSWKEIAAYLQRDPRTVRRWESSEGLPIHRHRHAVRNSVYAFPSELDAWRAGRKPEGETEAKPAGLWNRPLPSFATGMVILLALISVGDTTPEILRAQAQSVSSAPTARLVWTGENNGQANQQGTVSADGRYLSFTAFESDQMGGNVAVHDLATGTNRELTNGRGMGDSDGSAVSRDAGQVAYSVFNAETQRYELRLVEVERQPTDPTRLLYTSPGGDRLVPRDWSPDGRWIAVEFQHFSERTSGLGLISVADGSFTALKTVGWVALGKNLIFSPDGKFLAYDLQASDESKQHDVFVLAVDGSRETRVVVHPSHDTMVGWSPHGSALVFGSDRRGSQDLWSIRVLDGRPQGAASLLRAKVPSNGYLTAAGAYYYSVGLSGEDVYVASVDWETGRLLNEPVNAAPRFIGINRWPQWSPDGTLLAFRTKRDRRSAIGIVSMETGQMREILEGGGGHQVRWSPDGRSLAYTGYQEDKYGIYSVDIESGAVSELVPGAKDAFGPLDWSPDGSKLYYQKGDALFEWDFTASRERQLFALEGMTYTAVSPDGRWVAANVPHASASEPTASLLLVPISGGTPRELLPNMSSWTRMGWTPDSASLIVMTGPLGMLKTTQVFLSGREPRDLDVPPEIGPVAVHPDGKQVSYWQFHPSSEWWVLENFLPDASQ